MPGVRLKVDASQAVRGSTRLRGELKSLGYQTKLTEKQLRAMQTRTQKMGTALVGFKNSIGRATKALFSMKSAIGVLAVGMVTKSIVKTGMEFKKTMAIVRGVSRATGKEYEALEGIAKKMGETTEWSAKQAAEALQFLSMAGFSAADAVKALPGTLDLATAGNLDLGRAADIATNALTAMGLEVEELSRVNDVFVSVITRSNTNIEMMAESFKYAAPKARGYGYTIERLTAMIGALGNAGIQSSMAGTQLSFAFGRVDRIFRELGMDGSGKDLIDALEAINRAGWDVTEVTRVFGERGGKAAMVLRDMIPKIRELEAAAKASAGEAAELARVMRATLWGAFKETKSIIEGYAISTFELYEKEIYKMTKAISRYLREHKQDYLDTFSAVTGQIKDVIVVFIDLKKVIGDLTPDLGLLGGTFKLLGGAIRTALPLEELKLLTTMLEKLEKITKKPELHVLPVPKREPLTFPISKPAPFDWEQFIEPYPDIATITPGLGLGGEYWIQQKEMAETALKDYIAISNEKIAFEQETDRLLLEAKGQYYLDVRTMAEQGLRADIDIMNREAQAEKMLEQQKAQIRKQETMNMIQNWQYAFQFFGQHSKAMFALFKGFAIAETVINTIASAQAAYKAMVGIPIVGPGLAVAAAAAAIAAGIARVAQISAMEPGGGAAVAGGGGAAGTYPASPTTGLPEFPEVEEERRQALNIHIHGDFYGDEAFIQMLADKITEGVENRDVYIKSTVARD